MGENPLVGEAIAQVSAAELKPTGGIGLGHQGEGGEGTQVSLQATDLTVEGGEAVCWVRSWLSWLTWVITNCTW